MSSKSPKSPKFEQTFDSDVPNRNVGDVELWPSEERPAAKHPKRASGTSYKGRFYGEGKAK